MVDYADRSSPGRPEGGYTGSTMTDEHPNGNTPNVRDLSTADLVTRATRQVSTLIRDELALAKAELAEKAKKAGQGGALFGVAGVVAFFGVGALVATLIAALSTVWPVWLAALVVTVFLFLVAGVAVLIGRSRLKAATPLMPVESTQGISADVETVKSAVRDGLHEGKARD